MESVSKYVVKVDCLKEVGSGFVYLPDDNLDYAYVFTAKHCIVGKNENNGASQTDVQITFFDLETNQEKVYEVSEEDQFVMGKDNQDDIALIIIEKNKLPIKYEDLQKPKLFKLTGKQNKCLLSGIPKYVDNRLQRTLYNCNFLTDKDYSNQFQILVSDPITNEYNVDNLFEGYSGSGIYVETSANFYFCGIAVEFEEVTKRIHCIDFSALEMLLKENALPSLEIIEIETSSQILTDIKSLRENSEKVFHRIKDKIGQIHLQRKEINEQLKDAIKNHNLLVISGKAGVGKSCLAKGVLSELSDFEIIAIKGEDIDKENISKVFTSLGITTNIDQLLDSKGFKQGKILFLDGIEKLLETSSAETIIDFFTLIAKRADLKLIITCRSYAVEQLKVRFLQQFSEFFPFEVPLMDDNELHEVSILYPHLKTLLQNSSLKRILQIPFNIDKAVLVQKEVFETQINSELDFKRLMWTYVIENKERETDPEKRRRRGEIFSEISKARAKQMVAYAKIKDIDTATIDSLLKDNIIEAELTLGNRFSAAHDIYEDWALTRFIEDEYQEWSEKEDAILSFFSEIGTEPAIRRAFRIWVSEKLQVLDYNLENFIVKAINEQKLAVHWKDEILIAVIQSSYCYKFLRDNKPLLFSNRFFYLRRCLLLLQVAGQMPDFTTINQLKLEERTEIYKPYLLKPFGGGWENIINFLYENLSQLQSLLPIIISFLLQWKKILTVFDPLPAESRNVGLIILQYLRTSLSNYSTQMNRTDNADNVENCIGLAFRLSQVLQVEITDLIQRALVEKENKDHWKQRDFYEKVIEYSLSWLHSQQLCEFLPDLIIDVAKKEWLFYPPTKEEMQEKLKDSPFRSLPREIEKEEEFGLTSRHKYSYFPSSPYQTFISHLLISSPYKALKLIVDINNHSVDAFLKSSFLQTDIIGYKSDERIEVSIPYKKDITIKQLGSLELWCTYRGIYVATPNLLKCILMALEKWLLELAGIIEANKNKRYLKLKEFLDFAASYLIVNSISVTTSAVLISVATAYPEVLKKIVLPLFRVKEFYRWDLHRFSSEHTALSPMDVTGNNPLIQEERYKSKQLPHRKEHLENLIVKLSFGGYQDEIFPLLDEFYAEKPEDPLWKLALNRTDIRKWRIAGETDKGFIVQAEIDEDLKAMVNETEKEQNILLPLMQAANWGRKKLANEQLEDITFEEWTKHYQAVSRSNAQSRGVAIYNQPTTIAAIGLRDYFPHLDEQQLTWCLDRVFEVVENEINNREDPNKFDLNTSFNPLDVDASCVSLFEIVLKCKGEHREKAKQLLFLSLIFIHNDLHKKVILNKFRESFWTYDSNFALTCFVGLLEYGKLAKLEIQIKHFYPSKEEEQKEKEKFIEECNSKTEELFIEVTKRNLQLNLENKVWDEYPTWTLMETVSIIPYNSSNEDLQRFISLILNYILNNLDVNVRYHDEKIPYKFTQKFQETFAMFLLHQREERALSYFKELIDWLYEGTYNPRSYRDKKLEFVEGILKQLLYKVDADHNLISNFWIIWEYFFQKIKGTGVTSFGEILLLDHEFWNWEAIHWTPIKDRKSFFKEAIATVAFIKPTIKLLAGGGFTELMPEGINWFADLLKTTNATLEGRLVTFYTEKLIQKVFYNSTIRKQVKSNALLRKNYLYLLDALISEGSSISFLIREDFISAK